MMIPDIQVKQIYRLPAYGTWKETVHVFDARTALALQAAWLAERPLLVRGDPGTGKSQLARAAAVALGWELVSEVVSATQKFKIYGIALMPLAAWGKPNS